jgi:prevent-host-death family protein
MCKVVRAVGERLTLERETMYSTRGIDVVATITELRSKTSELVENAKEINSGILIQKNNEPYAVLISYELYDKLLSESGEAAKRRTKKKEKE